ncbi:MULTISPECIES: TfuA-like protein [unclassified Rhizobium]|uniref:TfuA-like protein n=1 Tax=unclassified Rhizobium TaxID=2613769 RepID=UPI0006FF36AE|nr:MULTISPECIES: TfuA-like protein [unclassified Rhizobium]KQV43939.1 antibiotic resistance protein [Rhizobium sp. Root1212]KRD38120.1 antibiotic resistance protein [Rhizobium sp. Root268]
MKVIFAGPSLPDAADFVAADIRILPPAIQGDVLRAVQQGATVIGLIDGGFEYTAPVWHKEILFALSQGVTVFGASSMGALRAAECETYGMIGVGEIFRTYQSGELVDDAEVALLHAPPELGGGALTLPMANIRATLDALSKSGRLSPEDAGALLAASAAIHFKERTWGRIFASRDMKPDNLAALMADHYIDRKRLDAIELVALVNDAPDKKGAFPKAWSFVETTLWEKMKRHL